MGAKIIVTVGPASDNIETLSGMMRAGARIFRLNFSHGSARDFRGTVERLRTLERDLGQPVTIMQDLAGPKIRTCDGDAPPREIGKNEELLLGLPGSLPEAGADGEAGATSFICLDEPELLAGLAVGDRMALSDGVPQFELLRRQDEGLWRIRAISGGFVSPRKGVAFPGKYMRRAALTEKDRRDLREGTELGLDAVAVSYVQSAEDVLAVRAELERLGAARPIVAKLERKAGVDDLERIIAASDAVMAARGDLGLECPLAELPGLQKRIIAACNAAAKPVIVATQMLLSMVGSPVPTRAETTDVANAVLDGADCLMLSEETAVGRYPLEAVEYMDEIRRRAEDFGYSRSPGPRRPDGPAGLGGGADPARFLAYAACLLAETSRAKALVAHTASGATARLISACRPRQPVHALSPDLGVRRFLNFSWGLAPVWPDWPDWNGETGRAGPAARPEAPASPVRRNREFVNRSPAFAPGDAAVMTAGRPKPGQSRAETNVVEIYIK